MPRILPHIPGQGFNGVRRVTQDAGLNQLGSVYCKPWPVLLDMEAGCDRQPEDQWILISLKRDHVSRTGRLEGDYHE